MKLIKKLKKSNSSISIKALIIFLFISLTIFTVLVTGHITFSNWMKSENKNISNVMEGINDEIINGVEAFINLPLNINKTNHSLLEKGVIDIQDETQRDRFFVGVLSSYKDEPIYSFSYGMETGEYYGARINKNNEIEIMKNNKDTYGHSWYYSVTKEMNIGILTVKAGKFDPRTRDWYKIAKESGGPVFSPIYKHFIMEDLALSAAYPIYDKEGKLQGVLGSHITLYKINNYLKDIVEGRDALTIIVEKPSGNIVSNSFEEDNFRMLENGDLKKINIESLENETLSKAYSHYKNTGESFFVIKNKKIKEQVNIKEYNKHGLDWLIITSIPESLFKSIIYNNLITTALLTFVVLLLSIIVYLKIINKLFSPIDSLIGTTEKFAKGDLSQRVDIKRKDEIGKVLNSFNIMADTITMFINDLESMVKERTLKLEKTNEELKGNEEELRLALDSVKYLSYHDSLTGLYNRMFFEEIIKRMDKKNNLPFSIISADVNGLKLTNDIFGHEAGDKLLETIAEVLKKACRSDDIMARIGGDEFVILLPRTNKEETERVINRIKNECYKEKVEALKCSVALGSSTKLEAETNIMKTLKEAEDKMYIDKTLNKKNNALSQIKNIIETLHNKSNREEEHSKNVSELSVKIGKIMNLNDDSIKTLRDAGYLHDIGKVVLNEKILNNRNSLSDEEKREIRQHPIMSYRILNSFDETLDLAKYALTHHERWNGSGYPKGLIGEEIPRLSRIIAVAENYEAMLDVMSKDEALKEIVKKAGIKFDPEVVDALIKALA